jgi:hypothetical protein
MLKERGGIILAVWPGTWSSDVFEVNDRIKALAALGESEAIKALSNCNHTFKIHGEHQSTSRTRAVEVELLCGCTPDYFGSEILDVQRQLADALGCQVKIVAEAAQASMAPAPIALTWLQAPVRLFVHPEFARLSGRIMSDRSHSFRYEVVKTYPQRGPLQQYRLAVSTSFLCSRCGVSKTSKLISTVDADWDRLLCNGCYGRLLSIWDIKAGSLEDEPRDTALLQMLASAAPAAEVMRVQSRLIASEPNYAQLSDAAQRMLATAHAVTPTLRSATGLDWSVAIIGLCKAVEVEAIQRIAEPLRLAASHQDISAEAKDRDFGRVARYCQGDANPPELGSLAYFLRAAANSKSRAKTSALVLALRTMTKAWPSADWLFADGGFADAVENLTREYRNPAAHISLLDEDDFSRCSNLVHGQDGLLWRLAIATSRSSLLRPLS